MPADNPPDAGLTFSELSAVTTAVQNLEGALDALDGDTASDISFSGTIAVGGSLFNLERDETVIKISVSDS